MMRIQFCFSAFDDRGQGGEQFCMRRRGVEPPPWRDVLLALRTMEARGEIRGGRFVAGFSGEQYAKPEAIELLRSVRRSSAEGDDELQIPNADPLNLAGILLPGPRINPLVAGSLRLADFRVSA